MMENMTADDESTAGTAFLVEECEDHRARQWYV